MNINRLINSIICLLKYREYDYPTVFPTDINKFTLEGHYIIESTSYNRNPNKEVKSLEVIISSESEISKSLNSFEKAVKNYTKSKKQHYIIIIPNIPSKEILKESERIFLEQNIYIEIFPYIYFAMDYPSYFDAPKFRIISEEEKKQLLDLLFISNYNQLPPTYISSDVYCAWLGAKPDDILEITCNTEKSLEETSYSICK